MAYPDSKIHGANVGPHVGHTNLAIWVIQDCSNSGVSEWN